MNLTAQVESFRRVVLGGLLLATIVCAAAANLLVSAGGPGSLGTGTRRAAAWAGPQLQAHATLLAVVTLACVLLVLRQNERPIRAAALVALARYQRVRRRLAPQLGAISGALWRPGLALIAASCAVALNLLVAQRGVAEGLREAALLLVRSPLVRAGALAGVIATAVAAVAYAAYPPVVTGAWHADAGVPPERLWRDGGRQRLAFALLWAWRARGARVGQILSRHRLTIIGLALMWLALHFALGDAISWLAGLPPGRLAVGTELFLIYLVTAFVHRWPSRTTAALAVGALGLSPLIELRSGDQLAEEAATFAYFALCLAVGQGIWELSRRAGVAAALPLVPAAPGGVETHLQPQRR